MKQWFRFLTGVVVGAFIMVGIGVAGVGPLGSRPGVTITARPPSSAPCTPSGIDYNGAPIPTSVPVCTPLPASQSVAPAMLGTDTPTPPSPTASSGVSGVHICTLSDLDATHMRCLHDDSTVPILSQADVYILWPADLDSSGTGDHAVLGTALDLEAQDGAGAWVSVGEMDITSITPLTTDRLQFVGSTMEDLFSQMYPLPDTSCSTGYQVEVKDALGTSLGVAPLDFTC